MAAYLYIEIHRIRDPVEYQRYVAAARPIVQSHGGRYVLTSERVWAFSGDAPPARVVLIRFPNQQTLRQCFGSAEYGAIAPLRELAAESRAIVIED